MGERPGLFEELQRRNVFRVAGMYLVAAWLLLQVGETTFDALGLPPGSQRLLIVLLALGFPVALVLGWIFDITPAGITRTSDDAGDEVARLRMGRRIDYVMIAGLLLALAVTTWQLSRNVGEGAASPGPAPPAATRAPLRKEAPHANELSIVVLPFRNMSGDPDQDYFAEGLTEDLTTDLTSIPAGTGLLVISRTTASTYGGREVSVEEVARQLGVRYVLEGSVRRDGDRVRVTAQLIDAGSGFHLWSDRYDREVSDIFAVQEEVVREIADALQLELWQETDERLRERPTDSLSAYDAYLRGRSHFARFTRADHEAARSFLERAVELDPRFADAWAYLGQLDFLARVNGWDLSDGRLDSATDHARRAIALDPRSRGANVLAAQVAFARGEPGFAELVERSAELAPRNPGALIMLAFVRNRQGRASEAEALMRHAAQLDPESPGTLMLRGMLARQAGRHEEAVAFWERSRALGPDNIRQLVLLGDLYQRLGRAEDARRIVHEILGMDPGYTTESVEELLGAFGRFEPMLEETAVENLRAAGLPDGKP